MRFSADVWASMARRSSLKYKRKELLQNEGSATAPGHYDIASPRTAGHIECVSTNRTQKAYIEVSAGSHIEGVLQIATRPFRQQKTASPFGDAVIGYTGSDCTLNLIGTEASGTSVHMARSSVNDSLDALDVGLPSTVGTSVGVRNLDTEGHALATKITLRHFIAPPILKSIRYAFAGALI